MTSIATNGLGTKALRTSRSFGALLLLGFVTLLTACGGGGGSSSGGGTTPTATLQSIAVTAASASIAAGATDQFTAVGTYSDGTTKTLTTSATWSSATTSVATIASSGLATGVAAGTSVITATSGGVSGTATLTVTTTPVTTATVASIAVTAASTSIAAGTTDQFIATATFTNGTTQVLTASTTPAVTWSSGTTAAATISASGVATGVAAGTSVITATAGGVSGTAKLTVTAAAVSSITVTGAATSIIVGATDQFTATATFTNGTTQVLTASTTPAVTWSSGTTAVATISASGLATSVAAGTSMITATAGGVSGSTTLTVSNPLRSIVVTPSTPTVIMGAPQQLTILATFSNGSTVTEPGSAGAWTSSNTAIATVGAATGIATGVATGTCTVTVTYGGLNATATLTVTPAEYAFVTNFEDDTVSSYSLGTGGSLVANGLATATGHQPFSVAADVTGTYLYVGNYNNDLTGSISEYSIGTNGQLTALPTPSIATGAGPNGMTVRNGYLYVANYGDSTNSVNQYSIGSNGELALVNSVSTGTATVNGTTVAAGAASVVFNSAGTLAYVPNFQANTISVFSVNATTGVMSASPVSTAQLPSGSSNPLTLAFDSTGTYAYVAAFGASVDTGNIAQFSVNNDGSLTALSTPVVAIGGNPRWLTLATASNTVYVANAGSNSVQVLSVGTGGALTLTATNALAAGSSGSDANPNYVVFDPTNTLLYVAERGGGFDGRGTTFDNSVAQFGIASSTGALSPLAPALVTAGSAPAEIALTVAN